jgi:hypothetical protein
VEIRKRLQEGRGYHAQVMPKNGTGKDCAKCHSEHNGEDFQLIRWEPSLKEFDHSKTGYPLEGKHAAVACKRCHVSERIPPEERPWIMMKDLGRTYLGLPHPRDCLMCHTDEHRGQLSKDCLSCHTMDGWKGAVKFSHAKTRYPLTGAHAQVACLKCHTTVGAAAKPYVKYAGVAFASCANCHTDPHRGAFPQGCQACHSTVAWKRAEVAGQFDHSKTKYPLLGKHEGVACGACHIKGDFKAPMAHAKCIDCHTTDPHHGQFKARKSAGECGECHDVKGFKPSLFTAAMHLSTKYPLEGRHVKVACEKCHLPKGADTLYNITDVRCLACH